MRNLDDWRRIAAEARTRAKDREVDALELELERDLDAARRLSQMARHWQATAEHIETALTAETAHPPMGRLDTGHRG